MSNEKSEEKIIMKWSFQTILIWIVIEKSLSIEAKHSNFSSNNIKLFILRSQILTVI